jgi:hypothetical protein
MCWGGRGGPGRGNGSAGKGPRGRNLKDLTVPTQRSSKIGACVNLGEKIFTISSGNKARYGNTLCTTKEAMVLYIGTHYGKDTSKEFATGVMTVLTIPLQDAAIRTRHQARLLAHQARLQTKIVNPTMQQVAIMTAIATNPQDRAALREKMEVEDNLSKHNFMSQRNSKLFSQHIRKRSITMSTARTKKMSRGSSQIVERCIH